MKKLCFLPVLFLFFHLYAQLPEDALRNSWIVPGGTAREQAIGGAMGSIGGDLSAASVNPAGLGLYKTREIAISPGLHFLTDKGNYLGNANPGNKATNFIAGTSGFVLPYRASQNPGISDVFAFTVNRLANYNNNIDYKGQNSYSSFSEQYVEEFAAAGLTINDGIFYPGLSYGTRMALYTSLIDTATVNGSLQVIGQPQKASLLNQENHLRTSGGITEIGLSLAVNLFEKLYLGFTAGIPIMNYTRTQTYSESDATGNTNNDFESFTYQERYVSRGAGLNLKLGAMYKPSNAWRVGLAIHTPTLSGFTDNVSASMVTRTENYNSLRQISISSDTLDQITNSSPNPLHYELYTPWKFIVSGSYVFGGEEENVRQQKGFITADIDYTTNSSTRFHPPGENASNNYDDLNATVKSYYKGSLGARLGGEMKFNIFMLRAGIAYYTSPYKDSELKADRLFLSGGLGYRNRGMFVDLTYVAQMASDVNFPYRLGDKNNVPATLQENGGSVIMTVGFKF